MDILAILVYLIYCNFSASTGAIFFWKMFTTIFPNFPNHVGMHRCPFICSNGVFHLVTSLHNFHKKVEKGSRWVWFHIHKHSCLSHVTENFHYYDSGGTVDSMFALQQVGSTRFDCRVRFSSSPCVQIGSHSGRSYIMPSQWAPFKPPRI